MADTDKAPEPMAEDDQPQQQPENETPDAATEAPPAEGASEEPAAKKARTAPKFVPKQFQVSGPMQGRGQGRGFGRGQQFMGPMGAAGRFGWPRPQFMPQQQQQQPQRPRGGLTLTEVRQSALGLECIRRDLPVASGFLVAGTNVYCGFSHIHCIAQIAEDKLTKTAKQEWSNEARAQENPPAFKPELVQTIYKQELGGASKRAPGHKRIMLLEISQYLENYLWPNFDVEKATFEHVMSLVLMVNEKFREGVPAWTCFHTREVGRVGGGVLVSRLRRTKFSSGFPAVDSNKRTVGVASCALTTLRRGY